MAIDGGGQALRISEIFLETQNCTTPGCCVLFSLKYYYWTTTGLLDYYYWTTTTNGLLDVTVSRNPMIFGI